VNSARYRTSLAENADAAVSESRFPEIDCAHWPRTDQLHFETPARTTLEFGLLLQASHNMARFGNPQLLPRLDPDREEGPASLQLVTVVQPAIRNRLCVYKRSVGTLQVGDATAPLVRM
jgi:hypothetical protein